MLGWALTFLIAALVAGFFAFTSVFATSAGLAQVVFVVFLILFSFSLIGIASAEPRRVSRRSQSRD